MARVPSGGQRKNFSMPAIISGLKAFRLAARDNLSNATGPRWLVSSKDILRFS
jgi:hypothetical protein